jgi:hypothetical protein
MCLPCIGSASAARHAGGTGGVDEVLRLVHHQLASKFHDGDRVSWHAVVGIETRLVVVAMPAPDALEDQQAHDNHDSPDDHPTGRRLRLSEQRLLGVVGEPLGVGVGGGILSYCYHSFH